MKRDESRKLDAGEKAKRKEYTEKLFVAELQFRFASTVRLATTLKKQPLHAQTVWTHGRHTVGYDEIYLRPEQADFAACFLQRSATYLMAVAIKDAVRVASPDPKNSSDSNIRAAYQIARMIRNAFAHDPFEPKWSIDADCRDKVFSVADVISLDTHSLDGTELDWRHYGGPLALFKFCRYVRSQIMGENLMRQKPIPKQRKIIYQQGDMIMQRLTRTPKSKHLVEVKKRQDGRLVLGGGYVLHTSPASSTRVFRGKK